MSNFQLISISTSYFPECIEIFNQEFGKDYLTTKQLNEQFKNNNFLGYCLISGASKKLIGLCFGYINYVINSQFGLSSTKKYVYIKSIAVQKNYHGRGVGKKLLDEFLKKAEEIKQDVFSTVWVKENGDSVFESMLIKSNFDLHSEHLNYWKESSLIEQFKCIKCGNPPCTCTMRVFVKKIQ
jgi:GNAT superfamily N-acetyltransferase